MRLSMGRVQANGTIIGACDVMPVEGDYRQALMSAIWVLRELHRLNMQPRLKDAWLSEPVKLQGMTTHHSDVPVALRVTCGIGTLILEDSRYQLEYGCWAYLPGGLPYFRMMGLASEARLRFAVVPLA